jgi:hypothetical protein
MYKRKIIEKLKPLLDNLWAHAEYGYEKNIGTYIPKEDCSETEFLTLLEEFEKIEKVTEINNEDFDTKNNVKNILKEIKEIIKYGL